MSKNTIKVTMQYVAEKIIAHLSGIMRMPVVGDVAYPLGRNLQYALQVESKFYRMRAELAKEFTVLDKDGKPTITDPDPETQQVNYKFKDSEGEQKYKEAVEKLFVEFPFEMKVYKFPMHLMAKVPQFAPMAMLDLAPLFTEDEAEVEQAVSSMQVVKDQPQTPTDNVDNSEPISAEGSFSELSDKEVTDLDLQPATAGE